MFSKKMRIRRLKNIRVIICLALLLDSAISHAVSPESVKNKLRCGVHNNMIGFGLSPKNAFEWLNGKKNWSGFEIDICRAIAAARFDGYINTMEEEYIEFIYVPTADRFFSIYSGQVDVLLHTVTFNMERDITQRVRYPNIYYYDGQGFVASAKTGYSEEQLSKDELEEKLRGMISRNSICVQSDTTTYSNLRRYLINRVDANEKINVSKTRKEAIEKLRRSECTFYTADLLSLYELIHRQEISRAGEEPSEEQELYIIKYVNDSDELVPLSISKEPLGPIVSVEAVHLEKVIRWVIYALIRAEELGVNQKNIDNILQCHSQKGRLDSCNEDSVRDLYEDPRVLDFLSLRSTNAMDEWAGFPNQWVIRIIQEVGNYGDIYRRNLSQLAIPRGMNSLVDDGGILFSPPF